MNFFQTVVSWFSSNHPDTFNAEMSEAELDQALKDFKPVAQAEVQQAATQASQDVTGLQSTVTTLQEAVNELTSQLTQSQEANATLVNALTERVTTAEATATTATQAVTGIETSVNAIKSGVAQLLAGGGVPTTPQANTTLMKDEDKKDKAEQVVKVESLDNLLGL